MKFAVVFAVLALAYQCLAAPSASSSKNFEDLIKEIPKYFKQQFAAKDPYKFPDSKGVKIKTEDLDLTFDQRNHRLSKASTFTVDYLKTDPKNLTATVKVNIPELIQSCDFNLTGTGFGKQISGAGNISVSVQGFEQTFVAVFENPDTSLQLTSLKWEYDLKDLVVSEHGLCIAGFTDTEVKFITQKFVEDIKKNKAIMGKASAEIVKMHIDSLIAGKTLAEAAAFVKSLIHN